MESIIMIQVLFLLYKYCTTAMNVKQIYRKPTENRDQCCAENHHPPTLMLWLVSNNHGGIIILTLSKIVVE